MRIDSAAKKVVEREREREGEGAESKLSALIKQGV